MHAKLWCALAAACLCSAQPASAANTDALPAALKQCAAERDDARRLACFDAEVARLGALPPPPTPEQKFGARGELAQAQERKATPGESRLEKLEGKVTTLTTRLGGELVVTLDNGQVWQQLPIGETFRLKVGDQVTVKPGALGSYSMTSPYGRSAKVKRIK